MLKMGKVVNMGDHVGPAYYFIQYFIEEVTGEKFSENFIGHTYCKKHPHEEAFDCQNKKFHNTLDPANEEYIYNLNNIGNYSRTVGIYYWADRLKTYATARYEL